MIFIEFKNEILRTKVLRMTGKGWIISIREKVALYVILSEAKNLILLLSFSPDVLMIFIEFKKKILRTYVPRMTAKGWLIDIRKRASLFVILSEAKNLILLLSFSPDVLIYKYTSGEKLAVFIKFKNEILRPYGLRMRQIKSMLTI